MTARAPRKQRGPGRPWKPGQSGNPAGRKPGSLNRHSVERIVSETGESPLQFLLRTMRNAKLPLSLRLEAAGKACAFVHPRLQLAQHFIEDHRQPVTVELLAEGRRARFIDGELVDVQDDPTAYAQRPSWLNGNGR